MKDVKQPSIDLVSAICIDSPRDAGRAVADIICGLTLSQLAEMCNAFEALSTLLEDKLSERAQEQQYDKLQSKIN